MNVFSVLGHNQAQPGIRSSPVLEKPRYVVQGETTKAKSDPLHRWPWSQNQIKIFSSVSRSCSKKFSAMVASLFHRLQGSSIYIRYHIVLFPYQAKGHDVFA